MKFELRNLPRNCTADELIAEIKRVDSILGKDKIIQKDFNKHARLSAQRISNRFGGWEQALAAAGLSHKYSGTNITTKMRQQSKHLGDQEILNELGRIAKELKQNFLTQENVNFNSKIISGSTVTYRFGSWEQGLKKANLQVAPAYNRKLSNEEYFENLLNVWTHLGRQPKYTEMRLELSKISPGAYDNRFGSWRKALESFIERMSTEEGIAENSLEKEQSHERTSNDKKEDDFPARNIRSIGLSLRYKVFSRDKFKCIKCGASPATDLACKLHADHILPFSKGGLTNLESLQTLCEMCNLGKGNRHSE